MRIEAAVKHFARPREFRVTNESAAAQFSFDAHKQVNLSADKRKSQPRSRPQVAVC